MKNTNEKISTMFYKCSVNVQKEKKIIIIFMSPKCAHEKLANFIVGMNLQYEPKDEEDCNNGGKSNPAYLHTCFTHFFHSCLLIVRLPAQLVAIK